RDGVEVAREVQVDVLHRDDLRVAASRRTPLHAEHRSQGRLANAERGVLAQLAQRLGDADGHGRLALARGGRVDPGAEHEAPPRPTRDALSVVERSRVSGDSPRARASASATWRTKAGSLRVPRCGTGAR